MLRHKHTVRYLVIYERFLRNLMHKIKSIVVGKT
jgi:hypothetical protein